MKFTINLVPRTKKNSQRIININGHLSIAPSSAYKRYEKSAGWYIPRIETIDYPVNIKAIYYMDSRRRVDLVNLHEALCDILVHYKVISDDNFKIVASMDGSRVDYDKDNPRTEVEITRIEE